MNVALDQREGPNAYLFEESSDALRQWLRRYQTRTGSLPALSFTFPPIVSWLRVQIKEHRALICGDEDAGFVAGFLLVEHALAWARGFRDRLLLDDVFGRYGDSFTRDRVGLAKLLDRIDSDLAATLDVFERDAPASAFRTLFAAKPEAAAAFLNAITKAWDLLTPAVKFGLVGGFDMVAAMNCHGAKAESLAAIVAVVVACDSHRKFSLPLRINAGSISAKQIIYAKSELQAYPRMGLEIFRTQPGFAAFTQGLCRNKSARGRFKSK
jgi:hypothetical protein